MLQLRDIRKKYQTGKLVQQALDGVSLDLREHEFVAILGPSGSGKTTLLNIIGGLDRYDSGDLIINGVSTKKYNDRDWDTYRNHTIGFVFQSYNLIPHQTILANVEIAMTISGVSRADRTKRAVEALEKVGLGKHIHKKPNQLSGGQMQRVAIARALVNDPKILLADEPTGALDSETSVQVMDLLQEVAKTRLVVMVTHNNELAEEYATRIIRIKDGKAVGDTDPFVADESQPGAAEAGSIAAAGAIGAYADAEKNDTENTGNTEKSSDGSKKRKRASMSFLTALSLSFNNLLTKKKRTALVSIAGSIGIIGIALITALSNGVNDYIKGIEEGTVLQYPITIEKQGINLSSYMDMFDMGLTTSVDDNDGEVDVNQMLHRYAGGLTSNDLESLKEFFDSGESGIEKNIKAIEYTYDVVPQIYVKAHDRIRRVNPEQALDSLGMEYESAKTLNLVAFYQMPETESLYQSEYEVKSGRWAQSYDECVVVLDKDGTITDTALYPLGLLDTDELDSIVKKLTSGDNVYTLDDDPKYTYDDFIGKTFKVINNSSLYKYDDTNKIWVDNSTDTDFLQEQYDNAMVLKVVGVVQVKDDSSQELLSTGINYMPELIEHLSAEAEKSDVVKAQMATPDINIFTGEEFGDSSNGILQLSGLADAFDIDEDVLADAFSVGDGADDITSLLGSSLDFSSLDLSSLDLSDADISGVDLSGLSASTSFTEDDMKKMLQAVSFNVSEDDIKNLINDVVGNYLQDIVNEIKGNVTQLPELTRQYLQSDEAKQIFEDFVTQVLQRIQGEDGDLSDNITGGVTILQEELNSVADKLVEGLTEYAFSKIVPDTDSIMQSFSTLMASEGVQNKLQTFIVNHIDLSKVEGMVDEMTAGIQNQIVNVVQNQLGPAIASSVGSAIGESISSSLSEAMSSAFENIDFNGMFTIDKDAFIKAFSFDFENSNLSSLLSSFLSGNTVSYENNLESLGYAQKSNPSQITIYPKDFDCKSNVNNILAQYNEDMTSSGQTDKVITYSDFAGSMMTSVSRIVNIVSLALIALVAISLVVSAIMISVITHISVLERKKEIGILRAIGASKHNIASIFNAETFITGLLAGALGIVVSLIACVFSNMAIEKMLSFEIRIYLTPLICILLIALSIAVNVISGLIPAHKASKSDPVIALRGE